MKPTTFFAMSCPQLRDAVRPWLASRENLKSSNLLDLRVLQLHRGGAAEDRHRHLEPCLLLDDLLGRHQYLLELVGEALLLGLLANRARDFLLEARIDVNDVPAHRHEVRL